MEQTRASFPRSIAARRRGAGGLALAMIAALAATQPGTARGQEPPAQAKAGAAQASLARYVPKQDNLFFYFEFDGLDAHQAAWKNSAAYKLLNDTKLGGAGGGPRRPGHRGGAAVGPARTSRSSRPS